MVSKLVYQIICICSFFFFLLQAAEVPVQIITKSVPRWWLQICNEKHVWMCPLSDQMAYYAVAKCVQNTQKHGDVTGRLLLLLEAYHFFFSSSFVFQMVHLKTRHKCIAIYLGNGIQIFNARSGVLLWISKEDVFMSWFLLLFDLKTVYQPVVAFLFATIYLIPSRFGNSK